MAELTKKDFELNDAGEIITKDNIDSFIPKISNKQAKNLAKKIAKFDISNGSLDKLLSQYSKPEAKYIKNFIKNTKDLSKVTGKDLVKANQNARQSILDHNEALQQTSLSSRAASFGMEALKGVLTTAAFTAIATAVSAMANAIITKFTEIVNTYEDGVKKINDLTGEVKTLESEQSSLNNELKESEEKLLKLQQIKMPTLFEKDEIENLKEYNKLLETQIRLKELEIEKKKQEANEGAQKLYKDSQIDYNYFDDIFTEDFELWEKVLTVISTVSLGPLFNYANAKNTSQNVTNWHQGNTWEQQTEYLKESEKALEAYNLSLSLDSPNNKILAHLDEVRALFSKSRGFLGKDLDEGLTSIFGDVEEVFGMSMEDAKHFLDAAFASSDPSKYIENFYDVDKAKANWEEHLAGLKKRYSDAQTELLGLDPQDAKNFDRIKALTDYISQIEALINNESRYKSFTEVYNSAEFSTVTAKLNDLAKSGQLTEEAFNNVEGIDAFKKAFEELGETDIVYIIYSIINEVNNSQNVLDNAAESAEIYAKKIREAKEATNEVLNNKKLFDEAIEKTKNGEYLDYDTVSNLIELDPSLANEFIKTADGYKIAVDALIAANEKYVQSKGAESLKSKIEETNTEITNAQAKINSLSEEKARLEAEILANEDNDQYNRDDAYKRISEIDEQINDFTNLVTEGKNAIAAYNLILGEIGEKASTIMSFSDISSSYELLNSTIEDFNSNGIINLSTLEKITDAYPELKNVVDQYLSGVINENELIAKLTESYEQDENGYYQYLLAKLGYNEDYVNAAFNGDDGIVEYFAKNYEIDLTNFRDYISRKKAVQATFDSYVAGGISEWWTEAGGWTEKFLNLDDRQKHGISDIVSQYQNALEELEGFEDPDSKFQKELAGIREKTQNSLKADKESSTSSSAEETKKTFDWIERAIEKVQKAFGKLGDAARSVYKTFTVRNKGLYSEIDLINKEIKLQEKAYTQYMKKAASVGISSDLANRVQNGAIDISEYDSSTAEIIEEYKEWYENAPLYSNVWRYSI